MQRFSLEGKVAIVTGGGRGIGRAIALAFAEAGADVVIGSRTLSDLESVAQLVQLQGRGALAVQTDIGSKADVDNLVNRTVQEFGTVDILVNNALTNVGGPILDLEEGVWDRVMNTDLKGYYLCSQAAGRVMREKRKGNIISVITGSLYHLGPPGVGTYMVAKAGIAMLTKALAVELGRYNVRVNAIAPGLVRTDITYPLWSNQEALKRREAQIPLGRLADPEEMASVAVFLASDASAYMTGSVVTADGGLQA